MTNEVFCGCLCYCSFHHCVQAWLLPPSATCEWVSIMTNTTVAPTTLVKQRLYRFRSTQCWRDHLRRAIMNNRTNRVRTQVHKFTSSKVDVTRVHLLSNMVDALMLSSISFFHFVVFILFTQTSNESVIQLFMVE